MKFFVVAALFAVAAATTYPAPAYPAAPAYPSGYKSYSPITLTAESDVRNLDGSGAWSYAQSDYTTREESYAQKQLPGYSKDAYGKDYGYSSGNTQKGSVYWVSPEGQKFTLNFVADENGFQPSADHLPVAPTPVPLPYARTGLGF